MCNALLAYVVEVFGTVSTPPALLRLWVIDARPWVDAFFLGAEDACHLFGL